MPICKVVLGALIAAASQGCHSPSSLAFENSQPEDVESAVRSVMMSYSSAREDNGHFVTGWEDEPLEAVGRGLPAGARRLRARYDVRVKGAAVEAWTRAELFVSHGAHRHTWDWIEAGALEKRLLERIGRALP